MERGKPIIFAGNMIKQCIRGSVGLLLLAVVAATSMAGVRDLPFKQRVSVKYTSGPELQGAAFDRLAVNRDGIAYVLSDKALARVFDNRLTRDDTFRPLVGLLPRDIALQHGHLYYLYDDQFLSNDDAGKSFARLPSGVYRRLAVAEDFSVLFAGPTNLALLRDGRLTTLPFEVSREKERLYSWANQFYVLTDERIFRVSGTRVDLFHEGKGLTSLAFRGAGMLVGTKDGLYGLDLQTGKLNLPRQTKLPCAEITSLATTTNGLWVGTTRGVFLQSAPGRFAWYASGRWLLDDEVIDLQTTREGDVFVLTKTGLSKIEFRTMTLAEKAAYFDQKIRSRHIRYGFCAELHLRTPGDITSAEMIDTDNDGSWSSYYLASQAFRFAVTGDEQARRNAWETFGALERLQTINGLDGFPSRTFERTGFKVSDPDRWHVARETNWEWKAHTSSDEITAQTFAYAVLYEAAARTPQEKARIASVYEKIISHILRHDYYLVDADGQPTLWGRWNPDYVNHYPPTIGDRRLNSAEIIAYLQFAHKVTGKDIYRQKAFELFDRHGYLQNITNSMAQVAYTPGFVFQGENMGSEWNHSDDLLAFVNYWTLHRFAFNETLRRTYAEAVRDHWELEKDERCPLWNIIYASTGAPAYDIEGAIWTLQSFPMDLINWTVTNSKRGDIARLPDNFRNQQTDRLLPPDERAIMRWNGNPFVLDGGAGGTSELAGDEFLLPYWMGRYLRVIQ